MVNLVDAKNLIAILLSKTEKTSCKTMIEVRDLIESKYSDIILDITRDSVSWAQRRYPYLFEINLDSGDIKQANSFSGLPSTFLRNEFFNPLGKDVYERIDKEVDNYLSTNHS
ncbi:hypothetical protein M0R19_00520 [Candidatus Pacearchaeota archaeon]|nr:hypothetical protein [Candidatus Pacearchaeota archaeon]